MAYFPDNVEIHGFAFAPNLSEMDMDEIHDNIQERNIPLDEVIFSTFNDEHCVWLVAASRYLTDDEVKDCVITIIENDYVYEYILISYDELS